MQVKQKFNLFEAISEVWGWFVIVLAFTGLGVGVALIIMYFVEASYGKVVGWSVGGLVVLTGIIIATKTYKGKGTVYALSRTRATPELDDDSSDLDKSKNSE